MFPVPLSCAVGVRNQPRLQLQRRSVPLNSSYAEVSAVLTTTMAHDELASFPYLLGLELNSTGETRCRRTTQTGDPGETETQL